MAWLIVALEQPGVGRESVLTAPGRTCAPTPVRRALPAVDVDGHLPPATLGCLGQLIGMSWRWPTSYLVCRHGTFNPRRIPAHAAVDHGPLRRTRHAARAIRRATSIQGRPMVTAN